jgi:predicted DNA-binding protein YlxM (UPF0122 family)
MHEAIAPLPQSDKQIKFSDKDIERFWSKVNKKGPDDCWEWMASKNASGYGYFWQKTKNFGAHRVAFMLENEAIPLGMVVCHSCDNPGCCNPLHLFPGTHQDNANDMVNKGRSLRGERNVLSKLKESDVIAIKELYSCGDISFGSLARKFSVTRWAIKSVIKGLSWRHMEARSEHISTDSLAKVRSRRSQIDHLVSSDNVIKILEIYLSGDFTTYQISDIFSVSQKTISRIISGTYCKSYPLPDWFESFESLKETAKKNRARSKFSRSLKIENPHLTPRPKTAIVATCH